MNWHVLWSWEVLWKVLFLVLVTIFAVMSVFVTVLGAKDIKRLLKHLNETAKQDSLDETAKPSSDDSA